jgi:hypothetical protein
MTKSYGYVAQNKSTPLAPFSFERRDVRPHDVQVDTPSRIGKRNPSGFFTNIC